MKRHVLICGLVGGVLIALLKWSEYRFLVVERSFEIYAGLIAATFAVLGIWLGKQLTTRRETLPVGDAAETGRTTEMAPVPAAQFVPDEQRRGELAITPRELQVLGLIAQGMSNREIAGTLFVSENTVKTHSSRVLEKLGARRRTQAVQRGKELGLLP